jgi:hypothetical protein
MNIAPIELTLMSLVLDGDIHFRTNQEQNCHPSVYEKVTTTAAARVTEFVPTGTKKLLKEEVP